MPYIKRDSDGAIVSVSIVEDEDDEFIANGDSELLDFISESLAEDNPLRFLISSDQDLSRVLEDLIDLLVSRGIINFTDFPEQAQEKLLQRRKARAKLHEHGDGAFLVPNDDILKL